MGIYETGVRSAWRSMMRVAEARIDRAGELGRPQAAPVSGADPVLLVHGYGNDHSSMDAFARSFQRDGYDVHAVDLPNFGYGDAMDDAATVLAKVDEIRAATGAAQVDLVGHSRGGLVARAAQQLLDEQQSVGRVVTVSSANQGLHLGAVDGVLGGALPEGMQQIRRGAELIDRLRATQAGHDVVAVGTDGIDGIMVPAQASRIDNARWIPVDQDRTIGPLSTVGHYGILRDDRTYEYVRDALQLAPLAH